MAGDVDNLTVDGSRVERIVIDDSSQPLSVTVDGVEAWVKGEERTVTVGSDSDKNTEYLGYANFQEGHAPTVWNHGSIDDTSLRGETIDEVQWIEDTLGGTFQFYLGFDAGGGRPDGVYSVYYETSEGAGDWKEYLIADATEYTKDWFTGVQTIDTVYGWAWTVPSGELPPENDDIRVYIVFGAAS